MEKKVSLDDIRQALLLSDFDVTMAHERMSPLIRARQRPDTQNGQPRVGGVLVLLYCLNNEWHIVLTRRREDLNSHAGQISFPGGQQEPGETLVMTALRETCEEVGVPETAVSILGRLSQIYIPPSDFEVHPFVGLYKNGRPHFLPDTREVAEILEVPLSQLLSPATRREEEWEFRGMAVTIPLFDVNGNKVWGATAIMLSEFIERLRAVIAI